MTRLLYLFFIIPILANGQTKISGSVTDTRGEIVPGANVFLKDTYDGTTTNATGKFEFSSDENGEQILVVTFVGYKEFQKVISLNGNPISVVIELQESINQLNAVTITAGSFTASDESRRTVFKALDIATTAGATADIAGALNTLPGTQKVGESGRLFVRGGDGNETRTFIDGNVVLDAYSPSAPNTPSRGRFLPFMFKGTSFSTGGYSAEYGQALSSVLALDSKDKEEESRTDIGLLSVGADVAHTQAWEGGSAGAKIQYTNITPYFDLISQEQDWVKAPTSINASGAFRQTVGQNGMFKFYGNIDHSNYALYEHEIGNYDNKFLYDLTNDFTYLNGFYQGVLSDNWSIRSGLSYTATKNDEFIDNTYARVTKERGLHAKTVVNGSISDHIELKAGVEILKRDFDQQYGNEFLGFTELITAGFVEADVYASSKFVTRVGVRAEHNSIMETIKVDPRISVGYKTGENGQVSMAYGRFRQTPLNRYFVLDQQLKSERAEHFIANYQFINNNRTFRVETYYKKYMDLVKYENADPGSIENTGDGFAKGFELFWRDNKSLKNVDYWISYSYLDTEREYLNFPVSSAPNFASRHNFSAVYKHFFTKLKSQLGLTYSFSSPRTYNDPNTTEFNGGRTPSYQDLSANISYLPKPYIIVHLSCTNLLGYDNIFGYQYSAVPDENGFYASRPITQPAKRFLFLGVFITLSKNKTTNQLPSL